MKLALRCIEQALVDLYRLDVEHRAEDFLLQNRIESSSVGNSDFHGALFLTEEPVDSLNLGIFLSEPVRNCLSSFEKWKDRPWSLDETRSFSVAAEEISHFHYVLQNVPSGRAVSQLELELQGEVDKFLITYFARLKRREEPDTIFEELFDQFFFKFRLHASLSAEEKERYLTASRVASRFILKWKNFDGKHRERAFRLLRRFYRLNPSDKLGCALAR